MLHIKYPRYRGITMSELKNAVIGTAISLDWNNVKNFILSFREYNTRDDLVLIMDDVSFHNVKEFLDTYAVTAVVSTAHKYVHTYINNFRYCALSDFLMTNHYRYQNILFSDVRDAIFQSDPFINLPENFFYFFAEDSGVPVKAGGINDHWVRIMYPQFYDQLREKLIICAGTVLGSAHAVAKYIELVNLEILKIAQHEPEKFKHEVLDQGASIYLGWMWRPQDLHVEVKASGDIIGTVHISIKDPMAQDKVSLHLGKILVNGLAPALVHQYDRADVLREYFDRKYAINLRVP